MNVTCLSRAFLSLTLAFAAGLADAQAPNEDTGAATVDVQALFVAGREEIVRQEIRLSGEQAEAFWPIYEAYQQDLAPVRDRHARLIADFLQAYRAGAVSEEMAARFVDDHVAISRDRLKLREKYYESLRAVLPTRIAARCYQLEVQLDAELQAELSLYVPLIDPV